MCKNSKYDFAGIIYLSFTHLVLSTEMVGKCVLFTCFTNLFYSPRVCKNSRLVNMLDREESYEDFYKNFSEGV